MKRICLAGLLLLMPGVSLPAAMIETYSFTSLNKTVPDGLASGVSDVQTISSAIDVIGSITVDLNIAGGFNGDLYCYLRHGSGFSVLLNRPGRTDANPFGYGDSGFNVTFSDGAVNGDIHSYQAVLIPSGALTGIWQPDARDIDPDLLTSSTPRTAFLSSFNGMSASGQWTLFISDQVDDDGPDSVLNSWGMQIAPVPEPVNLALGVFGAAALFVTAARRISSRRACKHR